MVANKEEKTEPTPYSIGDKLRGMLNKEYLRDQHIEDYNFIVSVFGLPYNNYHVEVNNNHKRHRDDDEWDYYITYKQCEYGNIYLPDKFPRNLLKTKVTHDGRYRCKDSEKYMQEFHNLVLTLKSHGDIIESCRKYNISIDINRLLESNT
jgi:hypothetical protein